MDFEDPEDDVPLRPSSTWMEFVLGSETYDEAWKALCRPFRDEYGEEQLGPKKFSIKGQRCRRQDVRLTNMNGYRLVCSHFFPGLDENLRWPCVVYLHGNSSSRLEAHDVLKVCLPRNLAVFCFDFAGSGRSEGDFVSLGIEEQKDLIVVLRHLRTSGMATSIGLWGRSMGAATAIFRSSRDQCISAIVADSAFANLKDVAQELVSSKVTVPSFVFDYALSTVRSEVLTRAGWDIFKVRPIDEAPKCRCPAYFGHGTEDDFVLGHHAQILYDAWGGEERHIRFYAGGHNDRRPSWWMHEVADWLVTKLDPKDTTFESVPLQQNIARQSISAKKEMASRPKAKAKSSDDEVVAAIAAVSAVDLSGLEHRQEIAGTSDNRSQYYLGKMGAQRVSVTQSNT